MEINLANKLLNYYHENGFSKTFIWLTTKSLKKIFLLDAVKKVYIFEKKLGDNIPVFNAKIETHLRFGSIKDLEPFHEVRKPWKRWHRFFDQRFQQDKTCMVCFHKDIPIGFIWISFAPHTHENYGLTIHPKDDEAYIFDLYVLPEYRKFQVAFELVSRCLKYLLESGKRKAIGSVQSDNKPNIMLQKLIFGFKITKTIHCFELLKRWGFIIKTKENI